MEILSYAPASSRRHSWLEPTLKIIWFLWGCPLFLLSASAMQDLRWGIPLLTFAVLWWVVWIGLLLESSWGWRWAWIVLVPWGLAAAIFLRRIGFIIVNGGMDSATQPGSPLAFLIGWVFETIVLTAPTTAILTLLLLKAHRSGSLAPLANIVTSRKRRWRT